MSEIPEWVRVACRAWGSQKRRMWRGADWHLKVHLAQNATGQLGAVATKHWHVDGYSESFMGRLMEDKMGAAQGRRRYQHFPEVYWGDGLEVHRAIPGMPEMAYGVLHLHYVFDPEFGLNARRKAALLSLKERAYWEALGRAEFWVYARLDPARNQASENIQEISAKLLHSEVSQATKAHHGRRVSELALEALQRPTLKLRDG